MIPQEIIDLLPRASGKSIKYLPVEERFEKQVMHVQNCWLWIGRRSKRGRPVIVVDGKEVYAHRYSYEIFVGPIPEDRPYVCHTCDTPLCVRPSHLFPGTQDDNMKDMVKKDRANKPKGEANGRAKLTNEDVLFIRANYRFRSKNGFDQRGMAERFGVCILTIQEVLDGRKWGHVHATELLLVS